MKMRLKKGFGAHITKEGTLVRAGELCEFPDGVPAAFADKFEMPNTLQDAPEMSDAEIMEAAARIQVEKDAEAKAKADAAKNVPPKK